MVKEYCEKNNYSFVDVYNDACHSGKDLMRPKMQRLLKDIKAKKIDKLVDINVNRLTRNNYNGFWQLNKILIIFIITLSLIQYHIKQVKSIITINLLMLD